MGKVRLPVMSHAASCAVRRGVGLRRERQHVLMVAVYQVIGRDLVSKPSCPAVGATSVSMSSCWHAVGPFRSILWRLDHRRQLKLLVVRIITFVSVVPLSVSEDLLVELNHLVHLVMPGVSCVASLAVVGTWGGRASSTVVKGR